MSPDFGAGAPLLIKCHMVLMRRLGALKNPTNIPTHTGLLQAGHVARMLWR